MPISCTSGGGAELAAELGRPAPTTWRCISAEGIRRWPTREWSRSVCPWPSLYLGHRTDAGAGAHRRGSAGGRGDRFQSRVGAELPPAAGHDAGVHAAANDPGGGAQRSDSYAARAIGREPVTGSLEPGKRADFAVIDAPDVTHWLYHFTPNACQLTVSRGVVRWSA